jgi:hypothetical protein
MEEKSLDKEENEIQGALSRNEDCSRSRIFQVVY